MCEKGKVKKIDLQKKTIKKLIWLRGGACLRKNRNIRCCGKRKSNGKSRILFYNTNQSVAKLKQMLRNGKSIIV